MTPTATSLRFVVLNHTGFGNDHFDLMLEMDMRLLLLTFRSPIWPIDRKVPLTPLGEHRRDYLTYEGPVSGGRGHVRCVARGSYDLAGDGINILITFASGTDHEPLVITDGALAMPLRLFQPPSKT